MADGPPTAILALLYGIAGILLLAFPPQVAIPKPLGLAALALVAACSLSFLPANWFGLPAWRAAFQAQPVIVLGSLATPQPWHTLEGLGMLVGGIVLGLFLICQPVDRRAHRRLAAGFTLGVGAYAALAIFAARTGWHHPWDRDHLGTFGFLPNRNHVGTLLMLGAIAGVGPFWDGIARRRWIYVVPLGLAIGLISLGILHFNGSRAGAILLFVGFIVWMAGVFRHNVDRRIMISALVMFVLALGIFVTSRSEAWERMLKPGSNAAASPIVTSTLADPTTSSASQATPPLSLELRTLIYKDAFHMIADNPITGVGLGNFRYIFPQYRQESPTERLCLHPESSWLQLAAEGGLLAVIAAAALVILAFLRLRNIPNHPSWAVRWASATAVLMFLMHCLIDVPGHRTATLWPALFLAGLAFRISPNQQTEPQRTPWASRWLFKISGVAFLAAFAWLAGSLLFKTGIPATVEAERARHQVYSLHQQDRREEAIEVAKAALVRTPLAYGLYSQWGTLELTFVDTEQTVDRLFAAERLLEPCFINTAMQEGKAWLAVDSNRSVQLFSEALARAERQKERGDGVTATFREILWICSGTSAVVDRFYPFASGCQSLDTFCKSMKDPAVVYPFTSGTSGNPELLRDWMQYASPEALDKAIAALLTPDLTLASWNNADRRILLRLWYRRGNRETLMQFLREQPSWEEAAWPIVAGDLARQKNFEQAWVIIAEKLRLNSLAVSDVPTLAENVDIPRLRSWRAEQNTPAAALRLASALYKNGEYAEVVQIAKDTLRTSKTSTAPAPLFRLAAASAIRMQQSNSFEIAWICAKTLLQQDDPASAPE